MITVEKINKKSEKIKSLIENMFKTNDPKELLENYYETKIILDNIYSQRIVEILTKHRENTYDTRA